MPAKTKATPAYTREQIAEIAPRLKDAIYHMVAMWDALREAERAIGDDCEINEEQITGLASGSDSPGDAFMLNDSALLEALNGEVEF